MTKEKIYIGRERENDVVIDHPEISKKHASIRYHDGGDVFIEDNYSANGVFVNGRRVVTQSIKKEDYIALGSFQINDYLPEVFKKLAWKNNLYTSEFKEVLLNFDEYDKKKKTVNKNVKSLLIRVAISAVIILILALIPNLNITIRLVLMSLLTPVVLVFFDDSADTKQRKLDELRLLFEDKLVCPKCKMNLFNNSSTYWRGKKQCPNPKCGAIWQN
jgi:hypothetical protein